MLAHKLALMNFEPKGPTATQQIPHARSLGDYSQFCDGDVQAKLRIRPPTWPARRSARSRPFAAPRSAPTGGTCPDCGGTLQCTGSRRMCTSCGYNSGCD